MRIKGIFLFTGVFMMGLFASCSSSDGNGGQGYSKQDNPVVSGFENSPKMNIPPSVFPSLGNPGAKIQLDLFFDPWCPPCRAMDIELRELIAQKKYADSVVIRFHLFPLIDHFPKDREASLLHLEMARNNLFLDFRKSVVDGKVFRYEDMLSLAEKMLNKPLSYDLLVKNNGKLLQEQEQTAKFLGLNHTPTLFINQKEITEIPTLGELEKGIDEVSQKVG